MRAVWSDENRTASYLDIERALAVVQGRLGIIPQEAADEIVRNCDIGKIDMEKLRAQTERIGYPILGVVSQLNALCRDKLGEYCHWGATTQDITDTATVLQIREGLALVDADLAAISASLADARAALPRHADRRPQQPAAGDPDDVRLQDGDDPRRRSSGTASGSRSCEPRVLVGEFGGACGTLASIEQRRDGDAGGPDGGARARQPDIAWHTVRDTIAEVGAFLGLVGGTLGKIAMDVKLMMQTEVAEVYEPFAHGPRLEQHDAAEAQPDLVAATSTPRSRSSASMRRR